MKKIQNLKLKELQEKIKSNIDLTDEEWDLFAELEANLKTSREEIKVWNALFEDSMIKSEIENETEKFLEENKERIDLFSFEENFAPQEETELQEVFNLKKEKRSFSWKEIFFDKQVVFAVSTFLIVVFSGWFLLNYQKANFNSSKPQQILSQQTENIQTPGNNFLQEEIAETTETVTSPEISETKNSAAFYKNPYLEDYIASNLRSDEISVMIASPKTGVVFSVLEGEISIPLKGQIRVRSSNQNTISVKIFDNNPKSFISDIPLIKSELSINNSGTFENVDETISHKFSKGLYYFTVENSDTDMILYVGKFLVK